MTKIPCITINSRMSMSEVFIDLLGSLVEYDYLLKLAFSSRGVNTWFYAQIVDLRSCRLG